MAHWRYLKQQFTFTQAYRFKNKKCDKIKIKLGINCANVPLPWTFTFAQKIKYLLSWWNIAVLYSRLINVKFWENLKYCILLLWFFFFLKQSSQESVYKHALYFLWFSCVKSWFFSISSWVLFGFICMIR